MTKIRVLHVVHDFLFGGIEAFLYYLSQAQLNNESLEVEILCCQSEDKILNKRIAQSGVIVHYIRIKPWDFNLGHYLRVIRLTNAFDIVHVHFFKPVLAFALRYSNSRIIYTLHSSGDSGRVKSSMELLKEKMFVRFINERADGIANNSSFTKEFWVKKGIHHPVNTVIHNGVLFNNKPDPGRAFREFPGLKNKFIVGTTSRFIRWKRIDLLIEAFNIFQKNNDDVLLLLVGDGEERPRLEGIVNNLKAKHKILFTGFKTNVTDFQAAMNVCVFPSSEEPFGLVAVECLHLGKPVIVFQNGGGITEVIEKIEHKNIVKDVNAMAEALRLEYACYRSGRNDGMELSRTQYADKFNVTNCEKKYFELYKTIKH